MTHSKRERIDGFCKGLFKVTGLLTIALLAGIFLMLLTNSVAFFLRISPIDFFTRSSWSPGEGLRGSYGMLSLLVSTLLVTLGSMLMAIPLGIAVAAYISEYASPWLQRLLKPLIEILASIPSVAIGFLGIVVVGPAIAGIFGLQSGQNALNGSILLAVMALPTIITIAEDAIHGVPKAYREASYGIGATRWQTLRKVTIPAAAPGIIAAVLLGVGRAIGETMTVLMATGNAVAMPNGFFDAVRTITATIAIEMGEVPYRTTHYFALFAIAGVLFLLTLAVNLVGEYFANRFRKFHAR